MSVIEVERGISAPYRARNDVACSAVGAKWLNLRVGAHLTDDNKGFWIDVDELKKALKL